MTTKSGITAAAGRRLVVGAKGGAGIAWLERQRVMQPTTRIGNADFLCSVMPMLSEDALRARLVMPVACACEEFFILTSASKDSLFGKKRR